MKKLVVIFAVVLASLAGCSATQVAKNAPFPIQADEGKTWPDQASTNVIFGYAKK